MVKCADCGFLSVRHLETRELREAEGSYRETGEIPRDLNRPKQLYEDVPLCFGRLRSFDPAKCGSAADRRDALQMEIGSCVGFTEWHHGFTPKEHREMLDGKELRDWQAAREDADRKWRKDQADSERRWRLAQLLVFGLAGGIIALVAALIQKG
jgi:hypothetical protein